MTLISCSSNGYNVNIIVLAEMVIAEALSSSKLDIISTLLFSPIFPSFPSLAFFHVSSVQRLLLYVGST